ncbi:hypothetical protein GCM10011511_54840 [Puia dinghuensis]|uniref:Uncharacterized protein n=2 Tax=Puia dinghuensis TaxID=1792502 RepID=A0A8J2UJC9_9BACT|nr:hypothetical protein GCM10011511_54840 [Puia dinghuensis]
MLLVPTVLIEYSVLDFTHGEIVFAQDDTYIHLAIARNLAKYGVWGITKYEFVSASSSILYTLLLAGIFKLWPAYTLVPLILNLSASVGLLVVMHKWLVRQGISRNAQLVTLLLVIFLVPLPVLIALGMEHTLQCLFSFLFIYEFSDWFGTSMDKKEKEISVPWTIYVYGLLTATVRYEGTFLILMGCLILVYYRRWLFAVNLGLFSLLPILIFGIYSISRGGFFIPNSVLIKSGPSLLSTEGMVKLFTHDIYDKLTNYFGMNGVSLQRLLFLLPLLGLFFLDEVRKNSTFRLVLIILTGGTFLHLAFAASLATFCRYEAYLIGSAIPIVCVLMVYWGKVFMHKKGVLSRGIVVYLCFLFIFPFLLRSTDAFGRISLCCINIYEQQYQAGRFLHRYYNNTVVSFNDIGAMSYQTEGSKVDLVGLGTQDVAIAVKMSRRTPAFIDSISGAKRVKIAVVHENWFEPETFYPWKKVAHWYVPNNTTLASPYLSFFAVDTTIAEGLEKNLKAFQSSLPAGVLAEYAN